MQKSRKKPLMINLVAALIMCLVTFVIGFSISSFALLDSRLESAQEKISELNTTIDEKNAEIKELNKTIDQKNENNVILAEKISEHAATIEKLNSNISDLEHDVEYISEVAIGTTAVYTDSIIDSIFNLSVTQQLILFIILLVVAILIVSITCAFIAAKSQSGEKSKKKAKKDKLDVENTLAEDAGADSSVTDENAVPSPAAPEEEASEELSPSHSQGSVPVVDEAIDLLYHNNLEESISELGGFKFGITNFDEILSDKSKGKAFGNSENGDFVAFMSSASSVRKLYIIPRYLTLSDSSVALRGTTDLFEVVDEGGNKITHGTLKIKSIDAPAVFACGENGWAIESKGAISALGGKNS